MNVFEDLVRGGGATTALGGGFKVQRLFVVDNIEGNPHDIIPRSLSAQGIPKPGDIHPAVPRIRCNSVTANPIDANKCEVTASYETLSFGSTPVDEEAEIQISINGSVQSVTTNQFFEGTKKVGMSLTYTYPPNKDRKGLPPNTPQKVVPEAIREQAIISISLSRLESEHPLNKAIRFVDRTNSKGFLGTGKKTWLCRAITGVSGDSGETYQVTYQFEFKSEGWDVFIFWADKNTGEIPAEVAEKPKAFPEAAKLFQLQKTADFGKLKLEKFGS